MKFKLDYKAWICGDPTLNKKEGYAHGVGRTRLLNGDGYMCCLGQFCKQIGIEEGLLLGAGEPQELYGLAATIDNDIDYWDIEYFVEDGINTNLTMDAIAINDDKKTTIAEKVVLLRDLFESKGHEIELVNFPSKTLKEIR